DQHPEAVVEVGSADEVSVVVRAATAAGLQVTAQPRGHGAQHSLAGTVLLRTTPMKELAVDPDARVLRVGAGVSWAEANAALDGTGLIALNGSSPSTTVVGYTLGGGWSLFGRKYGLAA